MAGLFIDFDSIGGVGKSNLFKFAIAFSSAHPICARVDSSSWRADLSLPELSMFPAQPRNENPVLQLTHKSLETRCRHFSSNENQSNTSNWAGFGILGWPGG